MARAFELVERPDLGDYDEDEVEDVLEEIFGDLKHLLKKYSKKPQNIKVFLDWWFYFRYSNEKECPSWFQSLGEGTKDNIMNDIKKYMDGKVVEKLAEEAEVEDEGVAKEIIKWWHSEQYTKLGDQQVMKNADNWTDPYPDISDDEGQKAIKLGDGVEHDAQAAQKGASINFDYDNPGNYTNNKARWKKHLKKKEKKLIETRTKENEGKVFYVCPKTGRVFIMPDQKEEKQIWIQEEQEKWIREMMNNLKGGEN